MTHTYVRHDSFIWRTCAYSQDLLASREYPIRGYGLVERVVLYMSSRTEFLEARNFSITPRPFSLPSHAHTHTRTHTHILAHRHTHTHVCMFVCVCACHIYAHANTTHIYSYVHTSLLLPRIINFTFAICTFPKKRGRRNMISHIHRYTRLRLLRPVF